MKFSLVSFVEIHIVDDKIIIKNSGKNPAAGSRSLLCSTHRIRYDNHHDY